MDLAHLASRAEVHDVESAGRRTRWRVFGRGSPLVLLHGGHGNWLHWARNVLPLSSVHRVLVPDLPGYGDSDLPAGENHQEDGLLGLVEALRASLDQLVASSEEIDLAGFSFGAMVSAYLAAHRGQVRRLCLLGPAGHGMARRQTDALQDWRKATDAQGVANAFRTNLGSFMLHKLQSEDDLAPVIYEQGCRAARFRSKAISRRGGLLQRVSGLECPVMAVWGAHDVTADPSQVGPALRQDRSDRDWCTVSDAGHWVQYERADAINALLLSWFKHP